jgi:hypothetical protein
MSRVGTGDPEEMFHLALPGRTDRKAACNRPQKVAQGFTHCVLPANIVESEKGRPQLATQATQAERIKSKNKSETHSQA